MNILLLSTIYPLPSENKGTSVCHFFTREWLKMGHNVRVVHNESRFPLPFYWIAKLFQKRIAAKTGAVVYTKPIKNATYEMDGVPIMRLSLYKPIPHGNFVQKAVRKSIQTIVQWLKQDVFTPDIIVGHFPNPQIEQVAELKKIWPKATTAIVMHGDTDIMLKVYGKMLPEMIKYIDMWGFRSKTIKEEFEAKFGVVKNSFICYSGIPELFLTDVNKHSFNKPLHNFLYVGGLVERKYPEKVVDALNKAYPTKDFTLKYIGDGQQAAAIKDRISAYDLSGQVFLLGRMSRDKIIAEYDKADCMVMISRGEAYGLVYLEAMARGCVTIASRREGFDGVIVDGENGFLCKAGDAEELAGVINRINALTPSERQSISENAIATARRLTDYKAAKMYIDDIINN